MPFLRFYKWNYIFIGMCIYIWVFNCVLLSYMPSFVALPCCRNHFVPVVMFRVSWCDAFVCSLPLRHCIGSPWSYMFPCFHINIRKTFPLFLWKISLVLWWGLHSICNVLLLILFFLFISANSAILAEWNIFQLTIYPYFV